MIAGIRNREQDSYFKGPFRCTPRVMDAAGMGSLVGKGE